MTNFLMILCFVAVTSKVFAQDVKSQDKNPFSAASLIEEVNSQAKDPRYYDWRRASYEIEMSYDYVDEANNFNNDGGHFAVNFPTSSGFVTRLAVRRFVVYETNAAQQLGRTPFRQDGLTNRYEYALGGGYALLEGRSFSRLSAALADFSHVMFLEVGIHYHHNNLGWVPKKNDKPEAMSGQNRVMPQYVLELGGRWNLYFPETFGIFYDVRYHYPIQGAGKNLHQWTQFSLGMVWVLGYQ